MKPATRLCPHGVDLTQACYCKECDDADGTTEAIAALGRVGSAAQGHYFAVLPRNRRQACWWWLRLRFQWHFWRQTRLIEPVWSWWVNRG